MRSWKQQSISLTNFYDQLAAFKSRGGGDYLMSHDMEDIVAVLDERPEIVREVGQSRIRLRRHLVANFRKLLEDARFREALSGHLPPDGASQSRVPTILLRMEQIAELS